jgi:hypothetical protein
MSRALLAVTLALLSFPDTRAADTSHYIEELDCTSGPYSLRLPKTYEEVRKIGPLQSERVGKTQDLGAYKTQDRQLIFNGLRLGVVTYSNDPEKYDLISAEIRSSSWRIAGPFRVGSVLPPRIGDVATKELSGTATLEFSGHTDTVRMRLIGRRISSLIYLCVE